MASRSLNKVMLIGNLTRDPELRYTPSGVAVCTFGMATNRSWKDADGNAQEAADFHRIVSWGKLAELCSQWLFKGRKAFVEGRLQTRDWTGQDSVKRTTTEIVIDSMLILDSRRQGEESPTAGGEEPQPVRWVGVAGAHKEPQAFDEFLRQGNLFEFRAIPNAGLDSCDVGLQEIHTQLL